MLQGSLVQSSYGPAQLRNIIGLHLTTFSHLEDPLLSFKETHQFLMALDVYSALVLLLNH